ncbi:rod shape-determining protein MreC [Peptostreptococcus equinus]|uniref:Cell shape-determining protein MreC n=1 Tax=Peptostreptococcus equinus TaxID=3003601 RepID=A0ABY7JN63_9FIRM|nr:rod shape-determining protein MreC [Peptostreptococcus sp. CBA3647]WAW14286.1 rod shape-determining protein MreC [Peptostreptococcus sp. CBA3647]
MKLSKNNKTKLSRKLLASISIIALTIAITAVSFSNSGRLDLVESNVAFRLFYGFGKHLNNVVIGVGDFAGDIVHFKSNADKLDELKLENEKLRQEVINLKSDKNKLDSLDNLKKSLNYVQEDQKNKLVSTNIIGKNDGDWYKSFIIDAGSDSGIEKNSIVINGDGVVGIVYSVNNKYSKAISLVDSRASVGFKISGKENTKGVITTSSAIGSSEITSVKKSLQAYLFDAKAPVKEGDLLVTSGMGLYPENIPIGKVTEVMYNKNKSMKTIKIKPQVDFKNLDTVSVIPPRRVE